MRTLRTGCSAACNQSLRGFQPTLVVRNRAFWYDKDQKKGAMAVEFREVLARERKARGLSQEDLAAQVQVSRQAVSKWENGDALPDLNKLLALADALDLTLDALCGREAGPPAAARLQEEPPAAPVRKKGRRLLPALSGFLAACLLAGAAWAWSCRNFVPAESAAAESALPDSFAVSGVSFTAPSAEGGRSLGYQFTPGVSGAGYTYQITFTDSAGEARTFDVPCEGGVCAGTAQLTSYEVYTVTVSITDGGKALHLAVAADLSFSGGGVRWVPLAEA